MRHVLAGEADGQGGDVELVGAEVVGLAARQSEPTGAPTIRWRLVGDVGPVDHGTGADRSTPDGSDLPLPVLPRLEVVDVVLDAHGDGGPVDPVQLDPAAEGLVLVHGGQSRRSVGRRAPAASSLPRRTPADGGGAD